MGSTRFALVLLLGSAWLGAAGPRGLAAQPAPLGPEVELPGNVFPNKPLLAVQPGGGYVVAWNIDSDPLDAVYYRYVAAGHEPENVWPMPVVSPDRFPALDAVTATPKGFDLLWHVPEDLGDKPAAFYRRHLSLQGVPDGEPIPLGGAGTDWVWNVRGNGFMAGWALPRAHGIAARRLTSSGQRTGPELRLNSRPVDAPIPAVLAVADGGFVAVWHGTAPGRKGGQVLRARRFSPAGKPLSSDFDVNTAPLDAEAPDHFSPAFLVAAAPGGGFAVAWMRDGKIYLRFFDAAGKALGPEVPAVTAESTAALASMAFDDIGNLALLWVRFLDDEDLQLQLFDPHGAPLGPPGGVRSEASDIYQAPWQGSVAWAGDSWLVAWVAAAITTHDFSTIFVRRFAPY
jgi:hypothetical protein